MWLLLACTPPPEAPKGGDATVAAHSGAPGPTDSGAVTTPAPGHSGVAPGHTGAAGTGGTGSSGDTGPAPVPAPDFSLVDLNPTSPTFGAAMSPRDELQKVSGWYFTHAS